MSLLNFLVKSKTRKDLLRILWGEGVSASVHQLALLSNAPYSAVHGELEEMKGEGLVVSQKRGRAEIFAKNSRYSSAKTLLMLLDMPKVQDFSKSEVSDLVVRANLAKFGAPLFGPTQSKIDLSLEETLVYGLRLARNDSTVARALPVVIAKNKKKYDLARLEYLARKNKMLPVLGFYLELTALLSKDKMLKIFARQLMDHRRRKTELFFSSHKMNKFEQSLTEKNTPAVARRWHFAMNIGMDSFESLFQKSCSVEDFG